MIIVVMGVFLLSGVLGFMSSEFEINEENKTANNNTIPVHASWGEEFSDVKSLVNHSDLIVIGSLDKQLSSYQPFEGHNDTFTDAKFNIEKVIKGKKTLDNVVISQYGGERPNGKIEIFDDLPLLDENHQYLLFLEHIDDNTSRDGKYQTVRGVQGFYTVGTESNFALSNEQKIQSTAQGEINKKVIKQGVKGVNEIASN